MLLCDSIIAGQLIGESGIAAINAVSPMTGLIAFFGDILSTGVGIIYTREMGAMRKNRADEIYGQGLIISIFTGVTLALMLALMHNVYFSTIGISGDILKYALQYYRFVPVNAFLTIVLFYLEEMVYSDGDELCNNVCYVFQIGGNIILSIILAKFLGMKGIILGSVIGNTSGIIVCCWHFFRKSNTLHFVWHLSFKDFLRTSRYGVLDSSTYLNWALVVYVMTGFITSHYGDTGLTVFAVVVSLVEFSVVMDGTGMALQPLIGTYYGEKNHQLIKRVMRPAIKAALLEGAAGMILICIFAKPFCGIFGITGGATLEASISAVRILSLGFIFCSAVSLATSYFMLIDHIAMSVCITCLQNGLLYILLPTVGSALWGINGMWAGFATSPALTLAAMLLFLYLRFGKDNFPFLLKNMDSVIVIMDDILTAEHAAALSEKVEKCLLLHQYPKSQAGSAALFVEEISLTVLERNKKKKNPIFIELSLFFESDSVLIIQRDSGELFDLTDPDLQIRGLSSFILGRLMKSHQEKAYLITTGYNRNMIRFSKHSQQEKR